MGTGIKQPWLESAIDQHLVPGLKTVELYYIMSLFL